MKGITIATSLVVLLFSCKVYSSSIWPRPVDSVHFYSDRTSLQCSNWPQVALVQLVFPWWQGSTCWVLPQFVQQSRWIWCQDHLTLTTAAVGILRPDPDMCPFQFGFLRQLSHLCLSDFRSELKFVRQGLCVCACNMLCSGQKSYFLLSTSSCVEYFCLCIFAN